MSQSVVDVSEGVKWNTRVATPSGESSQPLLVPSEASISRYWVGRVPRQRNVGKCAARDVDRSAPAGPQLCCSLQVSKSDFEPSKWLVKIKSR